MLAIIWSIFYYSKISIEVPWETRIVRHVRAFRGHCEFDLDLIQWTGMLNLNAKRQAHTQVRKSIAFTYLIHIPIPSIQNSNNLQICIVSQWSFCIVVILGDV